LPTYLIDRRSADTVTSPDDPDLVRIGELVVDADGNGRLSFIVPEVDAGDYVVMAFCPACAPTSAGRSMLPIADFRVTLSAPTTDIASGSHAPLSNSVLLGIVVLAALFAVAVGHRRFDSEQHGRSRVEHDPDR
jgi:hypothetical protein